MKIDRFEQALFQSCAGCGHQVCIAAVRRPRGIKPEDFGDQQMGAGNQPGGPVVTRISEFADDLIKSGHQTLIISRRQNWTLLVDHAITFKA